MKHWAAKYIGRGYGDIGLCWGLVQACCVERHGVAMPSVQPGAQTSQEASIRVAARDRGWRRVDELKPDCIIVMTGTEGRHVAYSLDADGDLQVLHATRKNGVESLPWSELRANGYHSFEFWSHDAR